MEYSKENFLWCSRDFEIFLSRVSMFLTISGNIFNVKWLTRLSRIELIFLYYNWPFSDFQLFVEFLLFAHKTFYISFAHVNTICVFNLYYTEISIYMIDVNWTRTLNRINYSPHICWTQLVSELLPLLRRPPSGVRQIRTVLRQVTRDNRQVAAVRH